MEYSTDISMKLIIFSYDYVSDIRLNRDITVIIQKIAQHPVVQLSDMDAQEFTRFYAQMLRQFMSADLYRKELIKSMFSIIIYKIIGFYFQHITQEESRKIPRNEVVYKEFLKLLFKYYKTQRSVSFYAEKLNLTQKYFSKVIIEQSGKSPLHWIQEMVLQYAKAQLKSSNLTVAQISEDLQFPNPSFFGTYFKKFTGLTPVQYRKEELKAYLATDR